MNNYVFEVAKVRQANPNIWFVGGRALQDIEVGDFVRADGSPEQKDFSEAAASPFSVIAIATSGYGIPVLSSMWTGNLTLQGEANDEIKAGQMLIRALPNDSNNGTHAKRSRLY